MRDVWEATGSALETASDRASETGSEERSWPDRVFFTRRSPKRACHNRAEVEALMRRRGFVVISPEDHPVADQVTFMRRARIVAGFAGSGLLHIGMAGGPKHVIVFLSQSYHAHNEYQMAAALGHRIDFVVSRPDVAHPPGRFSGAAYESGFTVDLQREGRFLCRVLDAADAARPNPGELLRRSAL